MDIVLNDDPKGTIVDIVDVGGGGGRRRQVCDWPPVHEQPLRVLPSAPQQPHFTIPLSISDREAKLCSLVFIGIRSTIY